MSKGRGRDASTLVVNGYSEQWLRKGFPWVYPKEVVRAGAKPGQLVQVVSERGVVLGAAIADEGFLAARVFRHGDGPLDEAWIHALLDRAAASREVLFDDETTGYRLVHGENDGVPGLRLDWWSHFAVITLDAPTLGALVEPVLSWLASRRSPRGVMLCYRPDPRDPRDMSGATPAPGLIAGHAPAADVRVLERGTAFLVRPLDGPDVGLYTDMREVRRFLEPYWGGTRVLNTFCYTGAFSVAAARLGATEVVSVDLSAKVLERAEENFRANELDPAAHTFLEEDTFKALDRMRRQGERFDRIILDPPSFSRSDAGVWSAKRDYPRLVAAAARVCEEGGWLIAASNQGEVSPRDFRGFVIDGLRKAGKLGQELHVCSQAPDFPAASSFPEGRYLKVSLWRVVDADAAPSEA